MTPRIELLLATCMSALIVASPAAGQAPERVSLVPVPTPTEWRGLDGKAAPSLAWLGDTALAWIDQNERQVIVTRLRDGQVSRAGRLGSGPGEFRFPARLITDARGRMVVEDPSSRRFTLFGPDLGFLASLSSFEGVNTVLLHLDASRLTVLHSTPLESPRIGDVSISGDRRTDWWDVFTRDSSIRSMIAAGNSEIPNSFVGAVMTTKGEIVVGNPFTYRMTAFDLKGTPVRRFGRPELPVQMETAAEAAGRSERIRRQLDGARGQGVSDQVLSRMAGQAERLQPKPYFVQTALATDTTGRLWVATTRITGGMAEIDLFDGTGRFTQTLRVRDRVRALAVRLPLVAVLVERLQGDEEGLDGIDLYRVQEGR